MILPVPSDADIERFMSYVDQLPNGCWFWTGTRSRGKKSKKAQKRQKWYGTFTYQGRRVRAHAFSFAFLGKDGKRLELPRELPEGHDRSHSCHFSLCVWPGHIDAESKEENQRQRIERMRRMRNPELAT